MLQFSPYVIQFLGGGGYKNKGGHDLYDEKEDL